MKRIVVKKAADEDIDRALEHCSREYPHRFDLLVKTLEATFRRAARHPGAGSPRYARELEIEGLRALRTPRFPYLVFYLETRREILIVRVLHQKQDIPSLFADE